MSSYRGDVRCAAIGRSSVMDGGSSKGTMSGTHRSGFAGVDIVRAKRLSRCCPIGRRPQGCTASIAGNRHGSCCADSTAGGSDRFRTSPTHRGHQIHRRCDSSGRQPGGAPRCFPPSLPWTGRRFAVLAHRGQKSVTRQVLDELKQQISLLDYLKGSGLAAGAPTEPRPVAGNMSPA